MRLAIKVAMRAVRYGEADTACSTPEGHPTMSTPSGSRTASSHASGRHKMGST
jgi:hypothetical protein